MERRMSLLKQKEDAEINELSQKKPNVDSNQSKKAAPSPTKHCTDNKPTGSQDVTVSPVPEKACNERGTKRYIRKQTMYTCKTIRQDEIKQCICSLVYFVI